MELMEPLRAGWLEHHNQSFSPVSYTQEEDEEDEEEGLSGSSCSLFIFTFVG